MLENLYFYLKKRTLIKDCNSTLKSRTPRVLQGENSRRAEQDELQSCIFESGVIKDGLESNQGFRLLTIIIAFLLSEPNNILENI